MSSARSTLAGRRKRDRLLKAFQESTLGDLFEFLGGLSKMVAESVRVLIKRPPTFSSIVNEMNHLGVQSFVIVAVSALAVGLVMSIQFGFGLARFGAKLYVPKIVTLSIVRELGPIFTALMMSGRVGAGIASEVGSMNVTQQIDAIRALGTHPLQKIVLPKVLACILVSPILAIMSDFIGIFGGMFISSAELGLSSYDYFFKSFAIVTWRDVVGGLLKSLVFGFIVGAVGCYQGLTTKDGTQGVGNATTQAVVKASVLVLFSDFVMTKFIWVLEYFFRSGGL